jgi:hypothetical protein
MALPDTWSELFPNRFLHADLLKGRKVTLTIKNLDMEVMESDKGKKSAVVAYFVERPLQLGTNKTNGFCLKRMFGNNPRGWIGKRITIFPTQTKFGHDVVDCIRIWGSPDIPSDMKFTVPQGRKKPIEMTMHKVNAGECGYKGGPSPISAPAIATPTVEAEPVQNPDAEEAPDFEFVPAPQHLEDDNA